MKHYLLLGLLVLLIAGCVEYDEELWLNADGSGRARVLIGVLTSYQNEQVINRYTAQKGIHLISKDIYRKQKYTYYRLEFRFDNLEAFNNLNDQISNADFIGKLTMEKLGKGLYKLKRRIALGGIEGEDEIEQLIFTHPLDNLKWHYKLHLPWKIVRANAVPASVNYAQNSVEWTYQTTRLWNKSQTMEVVMKRSFPWLPVLAAALIILFVGVGLYLLTRHNRRLHHHSE